MKKNMLCYAASVALFYVAEIMLFMNPSSIAGASLLGLALALLCLGVFFQWSAKKVFKKRHPASCVEGSPAPVSL